MYESVGLVVLVMALAKQNEDADDFNDAGIREVEVVLSFDGRESVVSWHEAVYKVW